MRRLVLVAVAVLVLSGLASAAGTVSVTEERQGATQKVKWVWTSSAGGAADKATSNSYNGQIVRLVTIPSGTAAPTDDYDITVADEDGADVLMGAGANRDETNTEQVLASSLGYVANDTLTLHVVAAGDAKGGTVILYIR